ncbi:MAG: cation-translocating P-type ATPase, partial [Myxococcales bacterium]|nr:cation-translocating P-type ATPase [Myxococcales bacterium]
RAMWASVRDAVSTLLGGNLGEMAFTVAGGLIQGRAPLAARQLMLVNLLTDALPALMIAVRPPSHTTPERLMGEGPERSLGSALERDIAWRAAITAGSTFAAWAAAKPLASDRRAGTVALLTLVGTQLGQTLWVGWRNPPVVAAVVASGALLVAVVQTPGVSRAAGSTPLGPIGLTQAGVATVAGTVASGVLPPTLRWLDRRFDLAGRVGTLRRSEVGRLVAESRVVRRLRSASPPAAEATPSVVTEDAESA